MSSNVRVHVRLGTLRLAYDGSRSFYESAVEPLIARAAQRGRRGLAPDGAASPAVRHGPATASADPVSPAPPSASPPPDDVFAPRSPEFGRFLRRLGPEAGEPDRQVVALAFYLWNYERLETFSLREIRGCFAALGLPEPGDVSGILADLTDRKRFVEPAGGSAWRLTKKGENYVKTRLLSA